MQFYLAAIKYQSHGSLAVDKSLSFLDWLGFTRALYLKSHAKHVTAEALDTVRQPGLAGYGYKAISSTLETRDIVGPI